MSCAGPGTSARASPTTRSRGSARLLGPLERADSPFAEMPKMPRVRGVGCRLGRAGARRRGRVRRVDARGPASCAALPAAARRQGGTGGAARACSRSGRWSKRRGRELRFSNLDKPFWPEEGITKGDLIAYYRDVAEVLVPHLRGRPFTMKRYPDGWQGKNFFQKNAPSHMPDWIERAPFPASTREGERRIDRLRGRQRRARAAVDGEHGLHRPAHVGVARRSPGAARLGHVRPRSVGGLGLRGGGRGRAARQADARPARARELPEDVRLARDPRARARSRAATRSRR